MINKNVLAKAVSDWSGYKEPVSNLSKRENKPSLVDSDFVMFNFDRITKDIHDAAKCPTSVDALYVSERALDFVEFKSGFKRRITKDTLTKEIARCKHMIDKEFECDDYWELFWKNQNHEKEILLRGLKLKAIESYNTLERKILRECPQTANNANVKVKLTFVIDEIGIENMESSLGELAGKPTTTTNCFTILKESLKRLAVQKDVEGNDYHYDSIDVISVVDFLNRVKEHNYA